jgi:hypothetical protein
MQVRLVGELKELAISGLVADATLFIYLFFSVSYIYNHIQPSPFAEASQLVAQMEKPP